MAASEGKAPRRGEEEAPAQTLGERFDAAERRLGQVSECSDLTDQCATLLAQARQEEAAGRAMTARDLVTRLECALSRAEESWKTLHWWVPGAIVYQVLVIGALVFLLFKLNPERTSPAVFGFLPYAAWGGLGGAVAALFGLYLHAAKRDFDRGYLPFYFLKPVLGVVLGPVMYLFVKAGLMATTGTQETVAKASSSDFLLLAAFTVGFGERFTVRLIDRVASAIFGDAEAPRQGPQRPPAEGPAPPPSGGAKGGVLVEAKDIDPNEGLVRLLRDGAEVQPEKAEVREGKFALSGLAPGEYEVQVKATEEADWRPTSPAKVKVEAGKETPFTLEVK